LTDDRYQRILSEVVTRLRVRADAARAVPFATDARRRERYDPVFADPPG